MQDKVYSLLLVAGLILVASALFTNPQFSQHYVSALSDWNYMREFSLSFDSGYLNHTVVITVPLPSDANFWSHVNRDCSDVRITVGRASSERMLPYRIVSCDPDQNRGAVQFVYTPTSHTVTFRLYYGNSSALDQSSSIDLTSFHAPRFDRGDFTVYLSEDTAPWGMLRMCSSRVVLHDWGRGSGYLDYDGNIPTAYSVAMKFYSSGWGRGWVYIPIGSCTADPSEDYMGVLKSCPNGVLLLTNDTGRIYVTLYTGGHTSSNASAVFRRNLWVRFYRDGDSTVVLVGDHHVLGRVDALLTHVRIYVGSRHGTYLYLREFKVSSIVLNFKKVTYSLELLTPRSPRISIVSPVDGKYYNTDKVSIDFGIFDPNGDLVSAYYVFDGNRFDLNVSNPARISVQKDVNNLSDGKHTLKVYARDSEDLSATETVSFYVDTVPPELNVSDVNIQDTNVSFHISATDSSLDGCYYTMDKNSTPVSITCDGNVQVSAHYGATITVFAIDKAGNYTASVIRVPRPSSGHTSAPLPPVIVVRGSCGCMGGVSAELNTEEVGKEVTQQVSAKMQPASPVQSVGGAKGISILAVIGLIVYMLLSV